MPSRPQTGTRGSRHADTAVMGGAYKPVNCRGDSVMTKLLITLSTFLLGSLGWYAGERIGMFTAFIASIVGTGVGVYVGRRLARHWGF